MYTVVPTRADPRLIILIIDCSGSTKDQSARRADGLTTIAEIIAHRVNSTLKEIAYAARDGSEILDYYYILAVRYYGDVVEPALSGELCTSDPLPISKIASNPLRVDDTTPVWIEPKSEGATPMAEAYRFACLAVEAWLVDHPDGPAPLVIHVTDGEPSQPDPTEPATQLTEVEGTDGPVIHFVTHVSPQDADPILFPDSDADLPNHYAKWLFSIASPMPPFMAKAAVDNGCDVSDDSKCFLFNAGPEQLMTALKIGTVANTAR